MSRCRKEEEISTLVRAELFGKLREKKGRELGLQSKAWAFAFSSGTSSSFLLAGAGQRHYCLRFCFQIQN